MGVDVGIVHEDASLVCTRAWLNARHVDICVVDGL